MRLKTFGETSLKTFGTRYAFKTFGETSVFSYMNLLF